MQLIDIFDLSLVGRPDKEALQYESPDGLERVLTFGEIEARSNRLARLLEKRGITRGDRLGFFLPNRVEFIDLFLACIKLGVIAVPINVLYREREIGHMLTDAEPKAVITTNDLAGHLPPTTSVWLIDDLSAGAASEAKTRIQIALDGDDPAAIVYTSGTTGRSKGAILTHNNFAANTVNLLTCWKITSEDRYLAVLPLFHVHGLGNGVHTWLAGGCFMRLAERFEAARAIELFESFGPTLFFGVPTVYVRLLEIPLETARRIGGRMRLFVSGSAPLPAQVMQEFREKFCHSILERYGMSETLMNISNPYEGERRPGTVGLPLPGVSVRLLDGKLREVASGDIGEVYVSGPNVSPGYWRRPDATAESFVTIQNSSGRPEVWFRTGDLGERAGDGYFTLCGRRTDLIISGGFNIYPREIEEFLNEQPGIREAVVCGVPDARRGELPVAWVVVDDPFEPAKLEEACRAAFASFKVPRAFVRLESLPRNALGKIQKHHLPPWTQE